MSEQKRRRKAGARASLSLLRRMVREQEQALRDDWELRMGVKLVTKRLVDLGVRLSMRLDVVGAGAGFRTTTEFIRHCVQKEVDRLEERARLEKMVSPSASASASVGMGAGAMG